MRDHQIFARLLLALKSSVSTELLNNGNIKMGFIWPYNEMLIWLDYVN